MEVSMPAEVKIIFDTLKNNGYEVYLVGGMVRDYFLHRASYDFDLATSATPLEMVSLFKMFELDMRGSRFGNVKIKISNKRNVEITTFRVENNYDTKRHPLKVEFVKDIKRDLYRRDFTMNAMAWKKDEFIDIFKGVEDIQNGVIRSVGNSKDRFREDPLRILRAIRFSAELNFEIEGTTYSGIKHCAYLVKNLPSTLIKTELVKMLTSSYPQKAIQNLIDSEVLKYIVSDTDITFLTIDQILIREKDKSRFLLYGLNNIPSKEDIRLATILLFCIMILYEEKIEFVNFWESKIESILSKLNFSKKIIKYVLNVIEYYPLEEYIDERTDFNQLLIEIGEKTWMDIIHIRREYFSFLGKEDDFYETILNSRIGIKK